MLRTVLTISLCAAVSLASCSDDSALPDETGNAESPPDAYVTYTNERFGYEITYPADEFSLDSQAQNGDGAVFDGPDGATLRVFGSRNALGKSYAEQLDALRSDFDQLAEQQQTGMSWVGFGIGNDGAWHAVKAIRVSESELLTAHYSVPANASRELRETGRIIVQTLADTQR